MPDKIKAQGSSKLRPKNLGGLGPSEQELRDLLNKQDDTTPTGNNWLGNDLPEVKHAPPFRSEPLVVGLSSTARMVDNILKIAPELRGRNKRVLVGPSGDVVRLLQKSGLGAYDYDQSNLEGTRNPRTQDITVNPNLEINRYDNSDMAKTLVHELSHSRGYNDTAEGNPRSAYTVMNKTPTSVYADEDEKYDRERTEAIRKEIEDKYGYLRGLGPSGKRK